MNREASLYLDLVRFGAAILVFLSHVAGQRFTGGFLWQLSSFGDEAVIVFFVLSGFVIAYVTDRRERSAATFLVNRAARLYSVVLPALLLTAVLDGLGLALHPEYYSASWGYDADGMAMQFLRAATFTNRMWTDAGGPGSNLPFWSLSYEAFYYLTFAVAVFAPPGWRIVGAGAVLALAGPMIASMSPVWLLGIGCYYVCTRVELGRSDNRVLMIVPVLLWVAYEVALQRYGQRALLGDSRLLHAYIVGPLFAAHLVGAYAVLSEGGRVLGHLARPIRWVSGATFSIYLFHLPIMQFLTTVTPWEPGAWQNRVLMIPGVLAVVFLLAEMTERRKDWWRAAFAALVRWRPSVPMRAE